MQSTVVEDQRACSVVGSEHDPLPLALASPVELVPFAAAPSIARPSGIDLPIDGGIVVGAFDADVPRPIGDPAGQFG